MRTVSLFSNDFKSFDCILVPDNVVKYFRTVLFYPKDVDELKYETREARRVPG